MLSCPVKDHRRGIYRSIVGGLGRFHGRDIDELSAKCPLRGVTWPSHRRGMGVDAHCERLEWACDSTAIHRRPPMIFNFKKPLHCTDDVTYHVTSPVQCNGLFKNRSLYGMGFRIPSTSLQYTTRPLLHYTAPPLLHCTALYSLHCNVLTPLHHHFSTALHCSHFTAMCSLHYTNHHYSTALHCTHFTVCSDPHLIKEPKIL